MYILHFPDGSTESVDSDDTDKFDFTVGGIIAIRGEEDEYVITAIKHQLVRVAPFELRRATSVVILDTCRRVYHSQHKLHHPT